MDHVHLPLRLPNIIIIIIVIMCIVQVKTHSVYIFLFKPQLVFVHNSRRQKEQSNWKPIEAWMNIQSHWKFIITPHSQSISGWAFCDMEAFDEDAKALGSKSAGCDSSSSFIVSVRISRQLSSKFGGSQPVFSLHIAPDNGVGILSSISWIFGTCTSQYWNKTKHMKWKSWYRVIFKKIWIWFNTNSVKRLTCFG